MRQQILIRLAVALVTAAFFAKRLTAAGITVAHTPRKFWPWCLALNAAVQICLTFIFLEVHP